MKKKKKKEEEAGGKMKEAQQAVRERDHQVEGVGSQRKKSSTGRK